MIRVCHFITDQQSLIGAGFTAAACPASRTAEKTVSAFPAFFIMSDTVTHLYHTDIPVMGIGKNVAEILFQNGFKPGINDGSSHRHTGKDFSLRTDVHMVLINPQAKSLSHPSLPLYF